ncbi:lysine-specific permease [Globomyces pollinis-pini]|nr:lysine-specific permease [Globomyces pollinis-pini]
MELESGSGGTKRKLKSRHIQMIAIGGTIGTGLFFGSGQTLKAIGPLGTLGSFLIAGLTVFCMVMSLGEMATLIPVTGSFNEYAARFHSPALGFAAGWAYWFNWAMTLPIELQACGIFLSYWFPNVPPVLFYMAILLTLLLINLFTVAGFGEVEYWLSWIKIMAIIVFIFVGFYVIFGQNLGFSQYNSVNGPFAGAGIWTIIANLPNAVFAFGGTELVGITAGEAANPRQSVPRAIKGTFVRLSIFYFMSILVMGLAIPSNYEESLATAESAVSASPFVAVMAKAKIVGTDHFMNFISLVAVFSAGNSALYASSRTMMSLAQNGYGPKWLAKTSNRGIPVHQLFVSTLFGLLTILTTVVGVDALFAWMIKLLGNLIGVTWILISISHIYFRKAYLAQGRKISDLPYKSPVGIAGDYFAIAFISFVLIFSGFASWTEKDKDHSFSTLLGNYIYILPIALLYIAGIIAYGSKPIAPIDVDLITGSISKSDDVDIKKSPKSKWRTIVQIIA